MGIDLTAQNVVRRHWSIDYNTSWNFIYNYDVEFTKKHNTIFSRLTRGVVSHIQYLDFAGSSSLGFFTCTIMYILYIFIYSIVYCVYAYNMRTTDVVYVNFMVIRLARTERAAVAATDFLVFFSIFRTYIYLWDDIIITRAAVMCIIKCITRRPKYIFT